MTVRVVVIGGTGFIGRHVVSRLCAAGHDVAVFHRGQTPTANTPRLREIVGEERDLAAFRPAFADFAPDVIVHMVLGSETQARRFLAACAGVAGRAVVVSSMDVYRAYDRYRLRDPGDPDAVPLGEDGPLRDRLYPYLPDGQAPSPDEYDKILVERLAAADPRLPCTVLRLPMVYGPGDHQHRFHSWLRRMRDGRPAILIGADRARWRASMGYVVDVAEAIALAATDLRAAGETYNVGEPDALTQREWIARLALALGWSGTVVEVPPARLPVHLALDRDCRQDWVVDTTRIRRRLGFTEPTAPGDAVRSTVTWELANVPADGAEAQVEYDAENVVLRAG